MLLTFFKRNKIIYRDKLDRRELPDFPDSLLNKYESLKSKTNHSGNNPLYVLEQIYEFMDEYNKFVATFSVCQKGCNHCCKINVDISVLEAEYIRQNINNLPQSKSLSYKIGKTKTPCPFLGTKGQCTIYKYRPFNCRTFHTLDNPKYCETGENHQIYGASSVGYGSNMLMNISLVIKKLNGGHNNSDIRRFFGKDS